MSRGVWLEAVHRCGVRKDCCVRKVFDAGDQFDRTVLGTARLNVDIEHAPEPLEVIAVGCFIADLWSSVEWILRGMTVFAMPFRHSL
jgi:hypothetical protein